MSLSLFKRDSLKTRVTLFTLVIFLLSIWVLVFYVSQKLRVDMQRVLGKQQFSTVSFLAANANRDLTDRLDALGRIAGMFDSNAPEKASVLAGILEARPVLQNQFNGGIVALGADGVAVAEFPVSAGLIGTDFMGIDSVAPALNEGRSLIGHPFMDTKRQAPLFAMTVPIRDAQSNVIGALVGLTDLSKPGFLDQTIESYYGMSGYFLLAHAKTRLIITSTGRTRLMERLPDAGVSPLIDRFVEGFDETGVMTDSTGVEILASARRIPVADWFIVAALPTDEAFALIYSMQHHMTEAALLMSILAGGLTWWWLRRELSPMLAAVRTLTALSDTGQPPQALPIARHNEIGELIGGFNRLLETLAQRETALHESEERFKALHDASFGGIAIHDNGTIKDCNQGLADLTGYSFEELIGMNGLLLVAPEYRELVAQTIKSGLDHRYDAEGLRKDGSRYHLSIRGKSIPYKGSILRVSELRDITERKEMEELVRQQALHDTLTRLPNRRLLNDRLRQTMAASKRNGSYSALMFLDLDNFKPLNDAHGHEVGDLLLIEVAERLKTCVRETDTVARFGGDEFVVLLTELNTDQVESAAQAGIVAEKVRIALSKPYKLTIRHDGLPEKIVDHRCTASIGVALLVNHDDSQEEILKRADIAMYQAKEAGRNSIRFYNAKA